MRYASIDECETCNGEGFGVSLFVQGCNFHCENCFNQNTWDFNGGEKWTFNDTLKLLSLVKRQYIDRISILGGEPLVKENADDVLDLLMRIKYLCPEKRIWLYTGYTWEQIFNTKTISEIIDTRRFIIVDNVDVLVDGEYVDSERDVTLKWRGSRNQRVINVQESIKQGSVVLWCD